MAVVAAIAVALPAALAAAEPTLESVRFDTRHVPPARPATPRSRPFLERLPATTNAAGEWLMINAVLESDPERLDLKPHQVQALRELLQPIYLELTEEPYNQLPSVLPWTWSPQAGKQGHYYLIKPEHVDQDTPVVVFLHGAGGNFLYYAWQLSRALPDTIIIMPSWRGAWSRTSPRYVEDALADAARRLKLPLARPWLIGLSDGGKAAFEMYRRDPHYQGLITITSAPGRFDTHSLRQGNVLMINGTKDSRFPIQSVRERVEPFVDNGQVELVELDADHFLMLSDSDACFRAIRAFIGD